ncbi:hypothetical protein FKP32DRAFT_177817 [Trametes sanguinea]|nr:hypothetical protein FKP32DRAFT_177817 [Trametes sanguinea]
MHVGRHALVYPVANATLHLQSDSDHASSTLSPTQQASLRLPPLVAKISFEKKGLWLWEEACIYRTLESLQGVIMPRCYGYYRRFVNLQETSIIPWSPKEAFPRSQETFDIFNMPNTHANLSILLLERLGNPPRQDRLEPPGLR